MPFLNAFFAKKYCNPQKKVIELSQINKEVLNMAFVITDECIACGACESDCPVAAISEGDGKFVIDETLCTECGCCADTCPVGAPVQQ